MDCSLPGFSVHGILQARTLEWVAISFSSPVATAEFSKFDRVPDELWTEVRDIVQETGIKTIPKKKKCKKAKWLSEEALQIFAK